MWKRLIGNINFVLLCARKPFSKDVGVSERVLGDRGDEEHWNRGQTTFIELLRQNFKEIVDDAGGIARNENGSIVAQSQNCLIKIKTLKCQTFAFSFIFHTNVQAQITKNGIWINVRCLRK
jgi:hypothetical protein